MCSMLGNGRFFLTSMGLVILLDWQCVTTWQWLQYDPQDTKDAFQLLYVLHAHRKHMCIYNDIPVQYMIL